MNGCGGPGKFKLIKPSSAKLPPLPMPAKRRPINPHAPQSAVATSNHGAPAQQRPGPSQEASMRMAAALESAAAKEGAGASRAPWSTDWARPTATA